MAADPTNKRKKTSNNRHLSYMMYCVPSEAFSPLSFALKMDKAYTKSTIALKETVKTL